MGALTYARRGLSGTAILAAAVALVLAVSGCGGGEDEPAPQASGTADGLTAPNGERTADGDEAEGTRGDAGRAAGGEAPQGEDEAAQGSESGRKREERNGAGPQASRRKRSPERAEKRATARKLEQACPPSLTRSQCKQAAEQLAEELPSRRLDDPEDCLEVASREDCEAMAKAAKEADETAAGSVNGEECVRNPTPHCEKVLGPILEAQYAASQEAGK